jgi:Ceramidase
MYQTSKIDWCEENYTHSNYIVEFRNTLSCLSFFIFPAVYYLKTESEPVGCLLVASVGLSSILFHGTLSLAGQLFDELTIVLLVGYFIECLLGRDVDNKALVYLPATLVFVFPEYNRFLLLIYIIIIPTVAYMEGHLDKLKWVATYAAVAFTFWGIDLSGGPCLHDYWHFFISLAAYEALYVCTYVKSLQQFQAHQ